MKKPTKKQPKILAGCRVTKEEYAELALAAMHNDRTIAGEIRSRIFARVTQPIIKDLK